jgi:23S rRNA (cytosine1962-C5)-methyltransferase
MDSWISSDLLQRLAAEGTTIHRAYSGVGDFVERYGDDLLLCIRHRDEAERLRDWQKEWAAETGFQVRRLFVKLLKQGPGSERAELLEGDASLPLVTTATELGLRYKIDFGAGYSTGFFPDQRENRRFLMGLKPQTVLNTFSYTCAFSVVAASAGAKTTSVDVAKKALDWGRENFALNDLSTEGQKFWPDDVRDVLRRQGQRGGTFDAIILDPPTFARSQKGKVFRVEDELPELAQQAFPLLAPGGHLLLSTNCESLTGADLEKWAAEAARACGRKQTPVTVPVPEEFPPSQGATTLWVRAD